jgi:type II secretory pathway pseudopilin PulG
MKLFRPNPGSARQPSESAFTMVEVALSLGILAFALVAIIGVLPSGMKVQRENREQTIIDQDASYLLEAIRSGSRGMDDLTNYVESITVRRGNLVTTYTNNVLQPGGYVPLTNGQHIVSLLSTPKIEWLPNNTYRYNTVTARMRAISGEALDKSKTPAGSDFAFRYQVTCEVMRYTNSVMGDLVSPALVSQVANRVGGEPLRELELSRNLYEVRLIMRWPLFLKGGQTWDVGRYRRTLRTLVSAQLLPIYTNSPNTQPNLYLFEPNTYISAY